MGSEALRERDRKWYAANRERICANKGLYRKTNPRAIAYAKKYSKEYREKNPEKFAESDRKRLNKPERKAYMKKYSKQYRSKNKVRLFASRKAWIASNPESYRESKQKDYKNNKESYIQRVRVRQAIQLGATVNKSQILELVTFLKTSNDTTCAYCGMPIFGSKIHIDHIVPLSRGGAHSVENLCASCAPCNLSKNNKTNEEWEAWKLNMKGGKD